MKLFDDVELIDAFPGVYLRSLESLVIADLHLGYESAQAEAGVYMPKVQFEEELSLLQKIAEEKDVSEWRIIIAGDIKYEFSELSYHEYVEVKNMLEYLRDHFREVILIKGNHDNFIARVSSKYGVNPVDEFLEEGYLILHGDRVTLGVNSDWHTLIMGHEHPAVALFDEIGVKEKLKCLLYGETEEGRRVIVLPAFSTLMTGSEINIIPQSELLSPILRKYVDVDRLKVLAFIDSENVLALPTVGELKRLYSITS